MEPPSFPAGGPQILRANPGSDAGVVLPLPSGSPPFQFEWSRAGAKLSERFSSSHNAGGVRLSISAARTGDSGVYTLQASNAAGKDTTRVLVEVSPDEMPTGDDPPTFLRRLQDLTVKVGTRTRFLVEIVSSTECRVTWYRNERRLMEAERIALVRDGNFWCADISAVSVDDAGRWTCTAENIGGRASCSAHLNVLVPKAYKRPEFVEELRALLTEQGTVSLECKVVGVPTPVLRWFKDSREIKAGDVFALTANAEDPTSLGTYTCEAVNCMGRAYSSSKVQVVGRASREGSTRPSSGGVMLEPPPIFTKELEDQFVRICDRLTLSCKIVVPPWPRTVVWYNKEGKVESNDKYHILEDGVGGYFIEIQTSEFPDEGEWKCVATSTGGRVGISTCYVSMDIPKNYRKPRFMENLQAVLTDEGLVSFECKVVGFPTPVLSWFKDGQELKPGDVYQLTGTNSLGSYCCIARNFMGQASSSAELTVEDIQNQLNEEEKLQLFSKNQAPKYLQGLKSVEAKIDEPFRFTIKVAIPPEPTVLWYRDEQPVDESSRCHLGNEDSGSFFLDIQNLEFMDQAEWKCVAMNDYGQSVTSCFLKLVIPRHYKKPRFLENLQAILSDEGAVNLECKVIGVPQPVLKWYKDGEELKPGDIHRIISGQDGTCCLGTYTCEAQNCMGIAASSASLLGFEDSLKAKNKKQTDEQTLQRNLSLSTIHEERTSQMYDTPVGDITLDDKGEISFSFDGKEVSVSLYETPDLTEEEALQIVEMYADQLSENVTEHNVVELPPLRFVKETSTSGNLLMEAIIIDVSPEYFTSPEEDLRTEADIEDISIADENGPPQLSLDQDVSGEDYLEKTMAILSDERADISRKMERKKSDSQKSVDDYFSLSRDRSSSEEKKDDETQVLSESDLQSFASAHSAEKLKSKSSKPSLEDGQESSDVTKTVLLKEDLKSQYPENSKDQRHRRGSRSSRRSTSSEKSPLLIRKEDLEKETNKDEQQKSMSENIKIEMMSISSSLTKVMNAIQIIERDIILKSELMSVAATASRSLEIINSLITPLSEIHSITDTITETENDSPQIIGSLFNRLPQSLGMLEQSLTIVEKCIDYESDNKTLVKKTCVSLIEKCGDTLKELITEINTIPYKEYTLINDICISNIKTSSDNIIKTLKCSEDASKKDKILNDTMEDKIADINLESKHLHHTLKVLYALRSSLKSVLSIIGGSDVTIKSIPVIKNAEIILDEISTPIQELQNALEQVEILSVAESDSKLPKYNTEIIESVINHVLKLRTAFEQLSTNKENKINDVLLDIIQNIHSISSQLEIFEEKNGKFDILHNDNKLEVLQTMAQILISLENSLPILDTIPYLKTNMSDFHKNLTKVLENVIESNDSTKYFTLLEICSAVSRINTSLNNMESRQMLSLAIIGNTLKIIQRSVHETIFENNLNKSVLKNINDLLLDIQETINQVEESTLSVESDKVEDLSIKVFENNKVVTVLEHVQKTIASMSNVISFENVENLTITQVFENIHPILTEIQCCVASLNMNTVEHSENVSDMTVSSFSEAIAHPLCELHQNITVLNEVICEIAKNHEITQFTAFAEPLIELQNTLEILQAEIISQYEEILQCPEILGSIANSVHNLQSCILKIQEHDVLELVDDMSTLDDISGIKTTADILLPSEQFDIISSVATLKIEELPIIHTNVWQPVAAQDLKKIKKNISLIQNSVIAENVKALPDDNVNLPIKSSFLKLELISSDIQSILEPISTEVSQMLSLSTSKLTTLVQPLEQLQESLSLVSLNINIYEDLGDTVQIQVFTENLLNLKADVDKFSNVLQLALAAIDVVIDNATKSFALRQLPEKLDNLLSEYTDSSLDKNLEMELMNLRTDVHALNTNTTDNNKAEQVNEIIGKINKSISKVQDESFNCTAQNLNILSHESNLIKALSEVEQCIATLHQCNFPEESVLLTSETENGLPQIAIYKEVESILHLDQIIKIVNTVYHESNEGSESDIKFTEEFFDTFTKEISLLRYLIKNRPSSKQIIKSIQVFYALLANLNDYKSQYGNTLSDEFNKCLKTYLYDMENCLKEIKTSLIEIIDTQSQLLFDIPKTKIIDDEQFLKNIIQSENNTLFQTTYSVLLNVIELSKPFNDNLKNKIIEELSACKPTISQKDDQDFKNNYDYLCSFLTTQATNSIEDPLKQITEKLLNVIQKYEDVKEIIGVGKQMIFMQCISDCIDILKQYSVDSQLIYNIEKCVPEEISIDELLLEISEPLDCFSSQIINIRNKIILASEKDVDLTELKTLESHTNAVRKINEKVVLCISNNELDNHDAALAVELNNKCHSILNMLVTLEDSPIFDSIKELTNPIEEIEKNLKLIISYNQNLIDKKSQSNKEKAEALLQQMEQHIEIIEIVEEVSAVLRLDDLKETASIVRELRGSIAKSESALEPGVDVFDSVITNQIPLTDKLQKALISLHSQALIGAEQDTVNIKEDKRQQIIDAVSDLQNNLIELTNLPLENKLEIINNAQIDIIQEEGIIIDQIKSDKQSTDDVAEQSLNLLKNSDDLQNLVPAELGIQESEIKDSQIEENCDSKYNLTSIERSEEAYASKSVIDILLENIQLYLRQDVTEIAKEVASCLNCEAVTITQEISYQICQNFDLRRLQEETTESLVLSDDQMNILSNLHKNLEIIITYEPARNVAEIIVEDKLLQFKNVAKNLYESIQNLHISTNSTIEDDKTENLAIASPKVIEPEIDGLLSENLVLSDFAEQNSNDANENFIDNEVLLRQKDSKPEDIVTNVNEYSTPNVDSNKKEDFGAGEENLVHYISEYVSEEVMERFKKTLPVLNTEHLEKSYETAKQLHTLCKVTNFDDTNNCNLLKEKLELSIELNESIMIIHNQILEAIKYSPTLYEKDELQNIQSVFTNLVDALETYITSKQYVELEKGIALDKSKPALLKDSIRKTEQTVDIMEKTDEVCKIEELEILSVNKEDDKIFDLKMSESSLIDKSDDSLINNEVIEPEHLMTSIDHEVETNSIQILEKLLKEINDDVDLFIMNVDNSESIQNNLDEVQSLIIKLKCDFDGTANDALNETLEDLECNVRSVQLQINEQSPPVLLKEECSNLQVIVSCLKNIEEVQGTALVPKINIVNNCSEEADQTIQLLNKACCLETNSKLDGIFSCLNNVKDILKSLRIYFAGDTETLIFKGIDVIQKLDQVEDTIFSLEKDIDRINDIDNNIKDNIVTAMHSVYGSISNIRGTISSIQKRYMYEKYGKPSQNFLKSIKNISDISRLNIDNKSSWINCAKFLRKVLNHFEDIKFYINFDRTARIPNDAAFTKIILREIITVLNEVQNLHEIKSGVSETINCLKKYVNDKNLEIEERTTLEVKDKIPIFINLSIKILEATEVIKLQMQGSREDLSVTQLIRIDDKEQDKITDHSTVIGQSIEVQPTHDIIIESAELVSMDEKKKQELVKVTIGEENVFETASKIETSAEFQVCRDHQSNDNEQLSIDKVQVREEKKSIEVDILKISSEGSQQQRDNVVLEKGIELQKNTSQCVKDENYKSDKTFTDISNVITSENDTAEKLNLETVKDSQPVSESLINFDNCEVLITNAEVETILKIEENDNFIINEIDASVPENQQSDILKDTLEATTSRELSEQIVPHTTVTKNIQLNEHKGRVNTIENTIHVGLLTNNKLDINDKNSTIEDHNHDQATDFNIEKNLKSQENQILLEKLPVDDIETENNKICEQTQKNYLLNDKEKDGKLQLHKDDTNEINQQFSFSELSAISEENSNNIVIGNESIGKKVEIYANNSTAREEIGSLPEQKNIQYTEIEANKDINKEYDILDLKDLPKKGENIEHQEVPLDKNTECILTPVILQDLEPLNKEKNSLINDTATVDTLCVDRLNGETSLGYVLRDTDVSPINISEESRKDNESNFKEQGVPKELIEKSVIQNEDDSIKSDRKIIIKDSEDSTKRRNTNEKTAKEDISKREAVNRIENVASDDSQLLQSTINEIKTEELMTSSITEKIKPDEGIAKYAEETNESILIPVVKEHPSVNVQTDLANKETEDIKYSNDHGKPIDNKSSENNILMTTIEMDINEIKKPEQFDNIESNIKANENMKEKFLITEDKTTVAEIFDKDIENNDQKGISMKKDILNKSDECSIGKEIHEEIIKYSIEKDTDIPDVNLKLDIETKETAQSTSENKEATEFKTENEDLINATSHKGDKKAPVKKNEENESLNTLESKDIQQIKDKEQSDNTETNFPADTSEKKEYSESEHKVMATKILEIDNKKNDHKSITLKDVIIKDDLHPIGTEKPEELVECNQPESADQPMSKQTIEKDIQKLEVIVVSDLEDKQKTESKSENKEAIEVKPENIDVINTKSHKGSIKKNGEKQPVDILESNDIQEIKEKEKSDNAEAIYPADISEKKEYLESEHKVIVAKILDIDNKKDDQESITLKKDLINKDDIQTISKDKQKELVECNQPESADQPMSKQTIEKDIQKLEVIVVSDIEDKQKTESKSENKEATEVKPENIGVTNTKSHTGSIKKNGEKQPVDILESNDIQKIKEKEKSGNAEASFTADIIEKKENPESENKATVAEKVEKDNKKDDQEKSKIKHHKPHVNLESDLENKKTSESKSENKEATEIKPENKEVIDDTSHKDSQKSPIKKNGETESLNIFEGKNIEKIKEKEKSDYTDANICEDKSRKKQYSESECKTVSTEVLDDKKHDQESVTLLNDVINKDDVLSLDKEKQKESGKRNKLEESVEKDKQKPVADAQTGLEKKEVTATKSYSDNICNEKATVKQNKENELVKVIKDTSLDQTGIQAQPDKSEDNFTDKLVKEKHVDSELKDMDTKIIAKSNEKEHQENIVLKDIKDSNDKSAIYKEKQEESLECNQTKSESQVMFNQPRENEKVASRGNKHYDQNNKEADIIEYNLHGKKSPIKKKEENDLVKDVQSPDIHEIKEQSDTNKENFTIDTIVKEEHIESVQKVRGTKTSKKDCKKDQENIILNDSDIDKSSINSESDNKNVYSQSIDKEKVEHHSSLQTDLENKQKKEDSKEIKEQKEQFNKNKEDAELINVNTIENKESIQIIAKNVISEFSEESCKNQENQDAISKDKAIVNYEESLVNIQLDSKTKEIENIDKSIQDSTFTCKQKESDFDTNVVFRESNNNQEISTIENNVQLINETNNVSKEKKSKSLEKHKDQDSVDKKTSEINIKQTEKYERNSKKKHKPKQKKTIEEYKEKNEEKSNIEVKVVMNEKNILFEKPIQLAANDEISNIINIEKRSLSIEESKSRSPENKKYTIEEDIRNNGKDIAYTTIAKDFTNTEQNENQDYLVCQKYNDNTYPKIETEKEKYRPKESPTFIDHNKTDYSLQFPRPPNYTSKSFDNEELISLNSLNGVPIYKAQTLMNEYRARSSYSPQIDKIDPSSLNYGERTYARCRSKAVSESRSTTSEKRATRDLKRKPVFSTFLTDRTAVESSRVKLTCSILSSGDPTITWHKNGSLVDDKQKFRSKFTDGLITLEVLNAIPNDSGEYSCTISNEYGSITSSANLKVYPSFEASPIPPTFTRSIRDVYHSLENELVLECRIRGQPLPSITWYKDDKPITLCERYQAHYLADGVCRLTVSSPSKEDSGKYTCHAESSIWSDQIYHNVQFNEKEHCVSPNILTLEKVLLNRQVLESRKPHFTNVISDYKVVSGGTIGLQVEIKGSPSRVEWLREGCSITDTYRNAQTYFDHGIYTLALTDVTEKESGLYTCRAWSSHGNVDMNASIIVVQPNQIDGKPAVIVSRPAKDVHISIGEDINISFRVQGEPKAKVIFMKGLRDITHSQRVCKMTSDDYVKFTLKRSVISDAGTYCILARNAYGCDRAFVTVLIRQRASSENLVSDWTYPMDDLATSGLDRNYKAVPDRIPSEPSVVDGGKNWVSLAWPKPDCQTRAPILAYKVESWLIGKEGGARWVELGITPRNCFDAFNLKQEEEYHFRVTPRNRYGWGESVQTTSPIGIGLSGDRPEFIEILPGQLKVLLGETATLCCTFKGKPTPEILWMKNGHDIEEDTNRVKITLNSFEACLNIENVKIEDEGRYSCEASNIHGRSSTYARMTVITDRSIWEADAKLKRERSSGVEGEYPPQFTMRLRDRRVQATYPVRLTCQVVGSPAPELTWFKNGEKISADGRHSMSQDEYFYTLEIAPTTLDDGGVYEAMARNNSGAISCRCSLVVDKGIRAYVAPEFCCGLEPLYQLREGEELRISAIVEAYPSVGVSWYRDGVRLRPSRRAIMTLDRDGQIELALAFVTARDAGVYTCTASNEVGRVSTSGKVEILGGENTNENVHAPPIFVSDESSSALYSSEPRFLRKPRSSEAREGDTVIIECEVIGDPKPEVYWLRDFLKPDYYRDANHFKRVGAGPEYRFEIPHAKFDYTGAYSVIAKNIHGEAKAIISLQILARDPNSSQDAHNIRYGRVEVIPRFEKELTDLLCYDGDVIEFECRVSANPEPDIRWFHYSEVVPDCIDFESSYHRGIARLKIKQVTAEDEGTYRCEASNSLGRATSSACLVVYPPGEPNTLSQRLRRPPVLLSGASTPRSTPRTTPRTTPARSLSATPGPDSRRLCSPSREIAPKFYTYPFNRVAEEGDTVVFQCAVKGLPPPWATWDKDGIIITASSRITIKEKDEMFRILEIEQVNIEDVGLYRITLENDYGRAEASARLEVISGKGKFHGTRSYSASPSRRALTYRRRTPSFSRQD